jgi:formylglycine-generating enzyme required for sulfatase activity
MNASLAVKSASGVAWILAAACCFQATESKPEEPDKAGRSAADRMRGKEAGEVRDDNGLKMKFVWCPPGFITMESVEVVPKPAAKKDDEPNRDEVDPKDKPAPQTPLKITPVKVVLTHGYWLGRYEVIQSEWKKVMATEPWKGKDFIKEGDEFPATYVDWSEAMAFCRKLTDLERAKGKLASGWEYTLPTEAQWERACRARTETQYSFGDDKSTLDEYAWFTDNAANAGDTFAHRPGQKKPNPWGLYDIHGNVWEWCRDWYSDNLPGGRDPEVTEMGMTRVFRGGSWSDFAGSCRSAYRGGFAPSDRFYGLGFRVALSTVRHSKPAEPGAEVPSTDK